MTKDIQRLKTAEYLAKYNYIEHSKYDTICPACSDTVAEGFPIWGYKDWTSRRWVFLCSDCYRSITERAGIPYYEPKDEKISAKAMDAERMAVIDEKVDPEPEVTTDLTRRAFDFNGNQITVVMDDDNDPWWVAKEVCGVLGLSNPRKAVSDLDGDEKASVTISDVSASSRKTIKVNIINESGLYSLILRSRKPEAKAFKKWMTSEVLPSIRKTGGYIHATPEMTPVEIMARAHLIAEETIARVTKERDELKVEADRFKHVIHDQLAPKINELKPKAKKYDQFMNSDGCINFTDLAHMYQGAKEGELIEMSARLSLKKPFTMSARKLTEGLRASNMLWSDRRNVRAKQKYIDKGWFIARGTEGGHTQTMVTAIGSEQIMNINPDVFFHAWQAGKLRRSRSRVVS